MLHRTDKDERPTKTVRETEAENVAFVVCQAVGLNTNTVSSDYIQLYEASKETLAASLDRIQHTSTRMITAILEDAPTPTHRCKRRRYGTPCVVAISTPVGGAHGDRRPEPAIQTTMISLVRPTAGPPR
ncbi:MAG: hypothetical protein WBE26_03010 [Phycisphaerae bacterium]